MLRRVEAVGPLGINIILAQELEGRLALARGQLDEASQHLRPLGPLAERAADIQFVQPVRASLAELALWQGRPDDAVSEAAKAISSMDFTPEIRIGELFALGLRAHADAAELARPHRAADRLNQAIEGGDAMLDGIRRRHAEVVASRPAFEPLSTPWLLMCEAEASRLHRRPDPAAWAAAADAWTNLGRPYPVAYARWREAEARLAARVIARSLPRRCVKPARSPTVSGPCPWLGRSPHSRCERGCRSSRTRLWQRRRQPMVAPSLA